MRRAPPAGGKCQQQAWTGAGDGKLMLGSGKPLTAGEGGVRNEPASSNRAGQTADDGRKAPEQSGPGSAGEEKDIAMEKVQCDPDNSVCCLPPKSDSSHGTPAVWNSMATVSVNKVVKARFEKTAQQTRYPTAAHLLADYLHTRIKKTRFPHVFALNEGAQTSLRTGALITESMPPGHELVFHGTQFGALASILKKELPSTSQRQGCRFFIHKSHSRLKAPWKSKRHSSKVTVKVVTRSQNMPGNALLKEGI
ncbi:unnamed protein product [Symbiodinium natans]|uniref:Uncharacterized protein n=1 Tax=Symbiodinium natans TaxID=878477 RepID=A0A812SDQ7_9DINO|nr:unnamed protein product [Symbiodinium natans]